MIPILYEAGATDFSTNGIGRLSDCVSVRVTEERNSIFEVEFIYPITGEHYDDITVGKIIVITHDESGDKQPFKIYRKSAPISGQCVYNAHHISYALSNVIVEPFSATSISEAFAGLETNTLTGNPFTFWTNKSSSGSFTVTVPSSCRALLAGQSGSILDAFGGGEYEWDEYTVKLYAHRGNDNGVKIRYGKNLIDLNAETDTMNLYTSVVPFWNNGAETVYGGIVYGGGGIRGQAKWTDENGFVITDENGEEITLTYAESKVVTMDLSSYFEDAPTAQQLEDRALTILNRNTPWVPKVNVKVDFVALWQTDEYKEIASLERVRLCDTVTVQYPALGVDVKAKVIKTVWNPLLERYDSIEIGDARQTYADAILADTNQAIAELPSKSFMADAIDHATEQITGGLGGYIVINRDAQGNPIELLIMDTPSMATAVNVWRWNAGGLGHSHSGYNGPYDDVAITQDGQINASLITIGKMVADMIEGGTLKLGGASDVYGEAEIYDADNELAAQITNRGFVAYDTEVEDYLKPVYARLSGGALQFWVQGLSQYAPVSHIRVRYYIDSETGRKVYGGTILNTGIEFDVYADDVYFYTSGASGYLAIMDDKIVSICKGAYNYKVGVDVPESLTVADVVRILDKAFAHMFDYRIRRYSTDAVRHEFTVSRPLTTGSAYDGFYITINADGTTAVTFVHPEKWREGLGLSDAEIAFPSGDAASPTAWTNVSTITTGSTLATLFNSISTMVKNVRFLKNKVVAQTGNTYGNDFNSYTVIGVYAISGSSLANAPYASGTYWILHVPESPYTWRQQFAMSGNAFYYRFQANRGDAWSDWTRIFSSTTPSVSYGTVTTTRPTVTCNGSTVTVEIANQLPAGTYGNGLWTVSPAPKSTVHFVVSLGSNLSILRINTSGRIDFNNSQTLSSAIYVIGSVSYCY